MKQYILILSLIWLAVVGISFSWSYSEARQEQRRVSFKTARSFFEQVLITREWNARHGGVYVPVTEATQPNPHLEVDRRDIRIDGQLRLTTVNPAYMTRQIAEIAEARKGIEFHITSLNPIRPENRPSELEARALRRFERGQDEYGQYIQRGAGGSFFYMAPLKTESSCLKCHAEQGYEKGDIRGGISVRLPFVPEIPTATLVFGHGGVAVFGLFGLVVFGRKLDRAYEKIKRQAVFDALTGIPNRLSFSQRVVTEFNRCRRDKVPLSILMCDVDNFKEYNDIYGHQKGDECLKQVSKTILQNLKRPGDFCARYGGEEFVVMLPNTGRSGALAVAEKIRQGVQSLGVEHEQSSHGGLVTLSLGLVSAEDYTDVSYEELIIRADTALYRAKEGGRNRVETFCGREA